MMVDGIITFEFPDIAARWSKVLSEISTIQLPEELVYEIFLRLPVKSLIRFLCVSKGICGMIDSPFFIKKRNERSISSDYAVIVENKKSGKLFALNFSDDMKRANPIQLDCSSYKDMHTVRCCNGIFCFWKTQPEERYVLWNPSNGTSKNVGCPNLSPKFSTSAVSMGYDYIHDDYKIVSSNMTKYSTGSKTLDVYSLKKDSWKPFNGEFPPGCSSGPGICVDSAIHWLWKNPNDSSRRFIAVFDFVTESFKSLPLPSKPRGLGMKPVDLSDFGGRLCVTFRFRFPLGSGDVPRVWVMKNYGVEGSWTPLYTVKSNSMIRISYLEMMSNSERFWTPFSSSMVPFYYFPNKERRLLINNHRLILWDPYDHCFERIQIEGYPKNYWSYDRLFIYMRNLIKLDKNEPLLA